MLLGALRANDAHILNCRERRFAERRGRRLGGCPLVPISACTREVSYPGNSVPGVTTIEDRLYFFSGSADLPPGQGVHERVAHAARYAALASVRHWRRMLSNFWPADFALGQRTYRTVEHAFQAAKIALLDPALAERFALESGTELARGDGAAARKHRKLVLLDDAQLRQWDERKHAVMREAIHAKFSRH
jgi:predicted NAD-dependent protein-ADP-ribosyltransferase YbiA (DUF1768 family)